MINLFDSSVSRKITLFLSLMVTFFTGIVGALGADSSIQASNANRQSQILAMEISQELQRSGLQSNYEIETIALYTRYASEELSLRMAALELIQADKPIEAEAMMNRADVVQSQARRLVDLSEIMRDPRYKIPDSIFPDLNRYVIDFAEYFNQRVKEQNAASDVYNRFDLKSTNYLSIVTLLSIILFLLGLAQAVNPRLRISLAGFSVLLFATAILWTGVTFFR